MNARQPTARRHLPHPRRCSGFTLVEAVISCLIMATILTSALTMVGAVAKSRKVPAAQAQGLELAKGLMAEILQCHYINPSGTTDGTTRATWNNVSDFSGFQDSPPSATNGTAIPGYTGWKRKVTVTLVMPAAPDTVSGTDQGLKRVTIQVTNPSGVVYTLYGLKSSTSYTERKASATATYTSGINIQLQPTGGSTIAAGVDLMNQVP